MQSYKIIDLEQGSPEWLNYRKSRIGGSDAPIIMGVSPWTTPYQLYRQKMDITATKPRTHAMQRGHDLEPIARQSLCEHLGVDLKPVVIESIHRPYLMASLDGMSSDGKMVAEIKCPNAEDHLLATKGIVTEKYQWQLYHTFNVNPGIECLIYFSYHEMGSVAIEFYRNDAQQMRLLQEEDKFMKYLNTFTEPELSDRDYTQRGDETWRNLSGRYNASLQMVKKWTEELEKVKSEIIEEAGQLNSVGCGIKTLKVVRKGAVDYNKIPELLGVDLEAYRKAPSESWRISANDEQ